LSGPPVDTDVVAATIRAYDLGAPGFAARTWDHPLRQWRERLLELAGESWSGVPLRILDAGCGPGRDVAWFAARGHRVVGGDLSVGMLAEARRRVPDGRFVRMDLRTPPFAPASFDAIWMCASLLHLPKAHWLDVLRRCRILLDRGCIFLSVKLGDDERFTTGGTVPDEPRFFAYVRLPELDSLLCDAGFHVRALEPDPLQSGHDTFVSAFATVAQRSMGMPRPCC